jgi:hypothetical protein
MRKFWRIGLVLLIGLSACGDKKAEQAKALQQELQDALAKSAAGSRMFTYGEVTVNPDGDAFAASIDKVAITLPEAAPVDLGKIGFKLTPDGDDIRTFSDLSLPQTLTFKGADGKEIKMTMALDHATGSWSKKMGLLLSADILARSIEITEPSSGSKAMAADVVYQVTSRDDGQGVYDQSGVFGSRLLTIADRDGQLALADLKVTSAMTGAKLAELAALRGDLQKASQASKPGELLPLLSRMFQLMKGAKAGLSIGQITAAAGGTTVFSLGGFGLDFGMQDTDRPKVRTTSNLSYAALSIPQIKALVGEMGAEVLPTDFGMRLTIDDLPVSAILANWAKTLPDTKMTDESAMMGTGMMAAGAAIQAIQQSAVTMTITDGKLKAPGLAGDFTAEMRNDGKSPLGFTGSADVELHDLDALIAKGQQYADQPTTAEIVGMLQMMRALSDHGTDAAGKPIDRFKVTMDAKGNTLVNGKSLMPPEAPAEPPANGGGGTTGTDSGTGTGQ